MANLYIPTGDFQCRKGKRWRREWDTNKRWIQGNWVDHVSCPLCFRIHGLDIWYFSSHKTPFECSIIPRSRGHRQLIEEMNILNKWTSLEKLPLLSRCMFFVLLVVIVACVGKIKKNIQGLIICSYGRIRPSALRVGCQRQKWPISWIRFISWIGFIWLDK